MPSVRRVPTPIDADALDICGARLASARALAATARTVLGMCRGVPWISPPADAYRSRLDESVTRLTMLVGELDRVLADLRHLARLTWVCTPGVGAPRYVAGRWPVDAAPVRRPDWRTTGRVIEVGPAGLVSVDPRALTEAAGLLDGAVNGLDAADFDLVNAAMRPPGSWFAGPDDLLTPLRARVEAVRRGRHAPHRTADELRDLARVARSAASHHSAAEAGLRARLLETGIWTVGQTQGLVFPWLGLFTRPGADRVLAGLAAVLALGTRPVAIVPILDPPQLPPPDGMKALARTVARSDDRVGEDGSRAAPQATVTIQRLTHADGTRTWVVAVPGMQSMGFGLGLATDNDTNARLLTGIENAMTEGVLLAMEAAGIPPREPVVLAGHSQGGMVAMTVAGAVAGRYRIGGVLAMGSPSVPKDMPAGVPLVRVQHGEDPIPSGDGVRTDVGPDTTLVVRATGSSVLSLDAHDVAEYVRTAEGLDAGLDAQGAVDPRVEAITALLGDEDTTAQTSQYQVTRDPDPPAARSTSGSW